MEVYVPEAVSRGLRIGLVLVSGDEDFVYAVNAVAYKGCRVEVAGFRSNTAPKLIDVADYFIDLGDIADKVRKEPAHTHRYYENHTNEQPPTGVYNNHGQRPAGTGEMISHARDVLNGADEEIADERRAEDFDDAEARLLADRDLEDEAERLPDASNFIRVTDDQ